ncbi:MAG: hypothetical protein H4O13_17740 [Xanthomonadales bacterium]|nr:hypothetical protein [Xanthomonadales bacterium]
MRFFARGLLVLSLLALAACATTSPVPTGPVMANRVGLVNLVQPQLTHSHVGVTMFGNEAKRAEPQQLRAPEYLAQRLGEALQARGVELVPVELPRELAEAEKSLIYMPWDTHRVREEYEPALRELMQSRGLDVLWVVESSAWQDPIGQSTVIVEGHGLYTRRVLGDDLPHAYAFLWSYGLQADTLAVVGAAGVREYTPIEATELDAATIPKVEAALQPMFDHAAGRLVQALDPQPRR